MKDALDSILEFIGTESLTDEEFESIEDLDMNDQVAVYTALLSVLESRELVSGMTTRLQYYFLARGVQVTTPDVARSNIFVGSPL